MEGTIDGLNVRNMQVVVHNTVTDPGFDWKGECRVVMIQFEPSFPYFLKSSGANWCRRSVIQLRNCAFYENRCSVDRT
jgi:hypothetical protein